ANLELTRRRLDVALGIIGDSAQVTAQQAHGFGDAQAAGRVGDLSDRVAVIRGAGAGGQRVTIHATPSPPAATSGGASSGGPSSGGGAASGGAAGAGSAASG